MRRELISSNSALRPEAVAGDGLAELRGDALGDAFGVFFADFFADFLADFLAEDGAGV